MAKHVSIRVKAHKLQPCDQLEIPGLGVWIKTTKIEKEVREGKMFIVVKAAGQDDLVLNPEDSISVYRPKVCKTCQ